MINSSKKQMALSLRVNDRLGLAHIAKIVGISKSSASILLKDHPIPQSDLVKRMSMAGGLKAGSLKKDRGPESKYQTMAKRSLSSRDRGRIAEAAVLFRFAVLGITAHKGVFDGDSADFIVQSSSGLSKVQVKWGRAHEYGRPIFKLTCSDGRKKNRRYGKGEFDFLIGYDLFADQAYVFAWDELEGLKTMVSARDTALEAWNKITGP